MTVQFIDFPVKISLHWRRFKLIVHGPDRRVVSGRFETPGMFPGAIGRTSGYANRDDCSSAD